ncbi:MAG: glutathionylspermidine synthase [Bradymonadia bacterium]|jgi:glutathionylspermidine synthase
MNDPRIAYASAPYDYEQFASKLLGTCYVSDPWAYTRRRFDNRPLIMGTQLIELLSQVAADIGALYDELCQIVWDNPDLLDSYYQLTPMQKLMWLGSGGAWHSYARMDAFWCGGDDVKVCELNADTPSGQSDVIGCSEVFAAELVDGELTELYDVNAEYVPRMKQMVRDSWTHRMGDRPLRTIGIVYPTDLPEDMALVYLYKNVFEEMGCEVVLGSPFNLQRLPGGRIGMFDKEIDVVWRHYKTDWWGEREVAHTASPELMDVEPLEQTLWLLTAEDAGEVIVLNPFGSMVAQDKRSLSFFWEHMDRFSEASKKTIRAHIPETYRFETIGMDRLLSERSEWVMKSDFGCESEEVVIGPFCVDQDWHEELYGMYEGRWVAQRFFETQSFEDGRVANLGLYLVGGAPAGMYVRMSSTDEATGHGSMVATPFGRKAGSESARIVPHRSEETK